MRPSTPVRVLSAAIAWLVLAACVSSPSRPVAPPAPVAQPTPAQRPSICATCGRIERIDAAPAAGTGKPQGAVLGGVVGGVISGPAPAPGKPAAATARLFRIVVLLDSGRRLILTQALAAGMKVGSRVRVDRSRAVLLR